jgi:hypothetical protein
MDGTLASRYLAPRLPLRRPLVLAACSGALLGLAGCEDSAPPVPLTEMTVQLDVLEATTAGDPHTIRVTATNTGDVSVESRACGALVKLEFLAEDGTWLGGGNPCVESDCEPVEETFRAGESTTRSRVLPTEIWIDCAETQPIDPGTITVNARISYIPADEEWGPENVREAAATTSVVWAGH